MDVDVDPLGRELEEQRRHRLAVVEQKVAVGGAQRALEQPVLDRAPVDEQVLEAGAAAARGRQAGKAEQVDAVALGGHGERVLDELAAHDLAEPGADLLGPLTQRGLEPQRAAAVDHEGERDLRVGHREALDHLARGLGLGALGLQELEPRRGRASTSAASATERPWK